MSKYTKGPWYVEDHRSQGDWRSTGLIWAGHRDSRLPGKAIAQVRADATLNEDNVEEFEANASLIAAAPEMARFIEEIFKEVSKAQASDSIDDYRQLIAWIRLNCLAFDDLLGESS